MPAPDLQHLARALAVRALSRDGDEEIVGAPLAVIRADALAGAHDDHPAATNAGLVHDEIMSVTIADMPPSTDLVAILLETLSQRLGGVPRAHCWHAIGVGRSRGRELLARNARALDWPIWYTLRQAALGDGLKQAPPRLRGAEPILCG